jgi:hypothetical protein
MEWLLRRNYWLVRLAATLIVAGFVANTVTTLLAMWIFSGAATSAPAADAEDDEDDEDAEAAEDEVVADAAGPWRRNPQKVGERILGRNAFCPSCSPPGEVAPDVVAMAPDGSLDFSGARRSELPLEVSATMESEQSALSVATVKLVDRGYAGLFGVGDTLMPGVQIVAIANGRIDILNGTTAEYVPVGRGMPVSARPKAKPTAAPSKPAAASDQIPGADEAIKCDEANCQVERRFVEGLIASPAQLMGQGRAAPAKTGDGEDGFRIGGVRRGTLPDLLGLKNGDIITEVGGKPLTMDSMLSLSKQLKSARHISVTIDRRGTKVTKGLELV